MSSINPLSNQTVFNPNALPPEVMVPREAFFFTDAVYSTGQFVYSCIQSVINYLMGWEEAAPIREFDDKVIGFEWLLKDFKTSFPVSMPQDLTPEQQEDWNQKLPAWKTYYNDYVALIEDMYNCSKHMNLRKTENILSPQSSKQHALKNFHNEHAEELPARLIQDKLEVLENKFKSISSQNYVQNFTHIEHSKRCDYFLNLLSKLDQPEMLEFPSWNDPDEVINVSSSPYNGKTQVEAWNLCKPKWNTVFALQKEVFKSTFIHLKENNFAFKADKLTKYMEALPAFNEIDILILNSIDDPQYESFQQNESFLTDFLKTLLLNPNGKKYENKAISLSETLKIYPAFLQSNPPFTLSQEEKESWQRDLETLMPFISKYLHEMQKHLDYLQYNSYHYMRWSLPDPARYPPRPIKLYLSTHENEPLAKELKAKFDEFKNDLNSLTVS